jgi:DNA processing protein
MNTRKVVDSAQPSTPADRAFVAALAGFDHMTTNRLVALQVGRSAESAFAVAIGDEAPTGLAAAMFERSPDLRRRWAASARANDPIQIAERCGDLGVQVILPADPDFPPQLIDDPRRPAVLFVQGDPGVLDARRVGIVGTRNPTRRGAQTAARFGHELADAGVVVVSGLALGIDGAAHRGVIASGGAPPVAVVANGHDSPYPKRHRELWREVASRGAVISEWPPGTPPDAFRFPQRNRILAALSELVVVIESRERGGSLITAREAAERGVDVFAVPGPIDDRASAGTNALLEVGAAPVSSTATLLVALGLDGRRAGRARFDARTAPTGREAAVLRTCSNGVHSVETVAEAHHLSLAEAAMALARLERSGWLAEAGGWFEMVDEYADLV